LDVAESGIRVGIIAREEPAEAWAVARARFPEDRKGQLTHQLAMKVSDSEWHHQLSRREPGGEGTESPYWLHPFTNYKTFCPYLVGDYDLVAQEVARYAQAGCRTLIIDVPTSAEDLRHIGQVFTRVAARVTP
jgi:alkanesulfonate monooxygenase